MAHILPILTNSLKGSITITCLVITMMLLIEYLNIENSGRVLGKLRQSGVKQIFLGCLFGIIPGCVGGFAAVSLYTHGFLSIGALVAAMICSLGDESFAIIATIPQKYPLILGILVVIGCATGFLVELIKKLMKKERPKQICDEAYQIHPEEDSNIPSIFRGSSYSALKKPSPKRVILIAGMLVFIIALVSGLLEDDHTELKGGINIFSEYWLNLLFAVIACITLLMTATAKEHFIKEHVWCHIIKKHLPIVFLWSFAAMIVCHIITDQIVITQYITDYMPAVVLLAALVGLIPEAGPHLAFIIMYASGALPFYVLLTSCISQQGHVSLPLLAESKRSWLITKALCFTIALAVGLIGWIINN